MAGVTKSLEHLLIVTPGFPDGEEDTSCLPAVQQFVRCYQKKHPEVSLTILTLHYPFDKRQYTWHGIPVHSMNGKNKHGWRRGITVLKANRQGININKQKKIDAVLSLWLTDASLAAKHIARKLQVPHLVWMHGQDAKAGNKYVRYVNPRPEQVAAISQYQGDVLQKSHGIKAAHIIHNGINKDIFPALNTEERNIDILAVGSLIPLKRHHLLVKMIKQLKDEGHKNIQAVIAGEGVLEQQLKDQIAGLGLKENIKLAGGIPHNEVLQFMNNARLFVHTSEYEGHSTVLLEALYSGCETLAFVPAGDVPLAHFTLCAGYEDMKLQCQALLKAYTTAERVLYTDMEDSAIQLHNILASML